MEEDLRIAASFDKEGNIIIPATLIGRCDKKDVNFIVDTSFPSYAAVPISVAVQIGLSFVGIDELTNIPVFLGKVKIGDKIRDTTYLVLGEGSECYIGMSLLAPYQVTFCSSKKEVSIEERDLAHLKSLRVALHRIAPRDNKRYLNI